MGISISLREMLNSRSISYECLTHNRTSHASDSAEACCIPEDNLAKGVLLRRKRGYLLAVIPASCHVRLDAVGEWLKEPVGLATESEVARVFDDCEIGCVPPVGGAYGLPGVMDDRLEGFNDVYLEGGDHRTLIHMSGRDFHRLTAEVPHAHIATRNH